ncbi:pyridoxamine 5'-phosphate oxidase family protein [Kiloniella sp. b19]|uniref:pyridoxamine 5'-phosphate oxidase family protein n=1 Tax=Kiloniella sp. GXU_MW_B19 TaxID=3141326 RepID=UPI0031DB6D79
MSTLHKPQDDELSYPVTERSRLKRTYKRGHYDHETVHGILDATLTCTIAYSIDGLPYATPTMHWRMGQRVYWHGSSASRMLKNQARSIPVCLSVMAIDGIVMARSAFHHSMNFRSVMAFGDARLVTDPEETDSALEALMERIAPGRWHEARKPNAQELKATKLIALDLEEVSAKIRTGDPVDDEEDMELPVWAGVLPVRQVVGLAVHDRLQGEQLGERPASEMDELCKALEQSFLP